MKIAHSALTLARSVAVLALAAALGACATGPNANPRDPLEPYNRSMTRFNDAVDEAVLKPVATTYQAVTPELARTGVSNFFANLGDAWSFVNNALQVKPEPTVSSFMRFSVNTFFGLGGLLDIATEMGMPRYKQDFGLTLGHWGVGTGPYVVLPILGPSTLRDTAALPVDMWGNPLDQISPIATRNSLMFLRVVDTRASLLRAGSLLDEAALDKYSFTRDSWLQLRDPDATNSNGDDANDGRLPEEP